MNCELPDVQAVFRKGRVPRDQSANIRWIIEKAREFQIKTSSASLSAPKPLTADHKLENPSRDGEYQTTLPASWEICMQVKKQQLELDMEQRIGSQIGKGVRQGCILSTCCQTGRSTSWNQDCREKYQLPQILQMTTPLWQKVKKN